MGTPQEYDIIMTNESAKTNILLEEIRGNVKLALEGHDVLRSEMKHMQEQLVEKIDENTAMTKFVANKVNSIDKKIDEHIRQPAHA